MFDDVAVLPDGRVHIGRNQWAPLDYIQRAVEFKTNTQLRTNHENEGRMQYRVKPVITRNDAMANGYEEEHLPLPSTCACRNQRQGQSQQRQQFAANEEDHLPLPSMVRK